MLPTTLPPTLFALVMYWFLGREATGNIEGDQLFAILGTLENNFSLDLVLMLPPIIVLVLVAMQKPALPTFAIGIFL
ncbi:MAG: hypothetical protein PHO18_05455, partial [Synergistaceae bacterium]|nr:hypothetical protein [Synergistaceae bacterium]